MSAGEAFPGLMLKHGETKGKRDELFSHDYTVHTVRVAKGVVLADILIRCLFEWRMGNGASTAGVVCVADLTTTEQQTVVWVGTDDWGTHTYAHTRIQPSLPSLPSKVPNLQITK